MASQPVDAPQLVLKVRPRSLKPASTGWLLFLDVGHGGERSTAFAASVVLRFGQANSADDTSRPCCPLLRQVRRCRAARSPWASGGHSWRSSASRSSNTLDDKNAVGSTDAPPISEVEARPRCATSAQLPLRADSAAVPAPD